MKISLQVWVWIYGDVQERQGKLATMARSASNLDSTECSTIGNISLSLSYSSSSFEGIEDGESAIESYHSGTVEPYQYEPEDCCNSHSSSGSTSKHEPQYEDRLNNTKW